MDAVNITSLTVIILLNKNIRISVKSARVINSR